MKYYLFDVEFHDIFNSVIYSVKSNTYFFLLSERIFLKLCLCFAVDIANITNVKNVTNNTNVTFVSFSLIKCFVLPISLALLADDDVEMRQWAVDRIIQIRLKDDTEQVRVWRKPTLKFEPMPKHYR